MDAKALAKSKRAHTLHNKNKNPHSNHHQKSKFQATTTNNAGDGSKKTKPISKQDKERARHSKLPSNWDRYDDDDDDENELETLPSDVVLPKSKGADFRYLVSEAQANSTQFLSLDDAFTGDFAYGVGSMLAVRGEGILSWIGNDNFVVDDQTTAKNEATFLSLNLQALAEQLAKVDASERLFIEAELLPPEMTDQGSKTNSNVESDNIRLTMSEAGTSKSEEFSLDDISDKNKLLNEDSEDTLSVMPAGAHSESRLSEQGLNTWNQATDVIHYQDGKSTQIHPLNHSSQINTHSIAESRRETSTFEASGADKELDMLLDSFSETKLHDSSGQQSGVSHISEKNASPALPLYTVNAPVSSKTTSIATNLDDALDDLLEETSNLLNHNDSYKPAADAGVKGTGIDFHSSSSQSVDKSKVLDDFDSWFDTL